MSNRSGTVPRFKSFVLAALFLAGVQGAGDIRADELEVAIS